MHLDNGALGRNRIAGRGFVLSHGGVCHHIGSSSSILLETAYRRPQGTCSSFVSPPSRQNTPWLEDAPVQREDQNTVEIRGQTKGASTRALASRPQSEARSPDMSGRSNRLPPIEGLRGARMDGIP